MRAEAEQLTSRIASLENDLAATRTSLMIRIESRS